MKSQNKISAAVKTVSTPIERHSDYGQFDAIDGQHSFKDAVTDGYVDYQVRTRPGGSVFYFNFQLAREMGLLPASHPDRLTPELRQKILETFSLVIINEYDIENATPIRSKDIRTHRYMATRYLQLQHPNKQGKTSGDGRGIWNGEWKSKDVTWDISSSGTGATKLSPAHAQTQKFFKTGDKMVGYGNGYNCVSDGLSAALMSEVFHQNGIETERTLAIISFEGGSSINVRAGKNLFRPAHFFGHLKQGNYASLKSSIDYFINREVRNGIWSQFPSSPTARYKEFARQMALTFSKIAAQYEAEYIFCWLEWDGDNILGNGGIIDYGSVRQFGLYHHEYRYDDVDRMSTNIPEQKLKARYIAQSFAQIADFLISGKKKNLSQFKKSELIKLFDQNFEKVLNGIILKKLGLNAGQVDYLIDAHPALVKNFKKVHSYFEKAKSKRGIYKIHDGITWDAVFCMKDLHRELPKHLLTHKTVKPEEFIQILKSSYAKPKDLKLSLSRTAKIKQFEKLYLKIMKLISDRFHDGVLKKTLSQSIMRASVANPENRITGDGVLHVTATIIRNQRSMNFQERSEIIEHVVKHQKEQKTPSVSENTKTGKILHSQVKAIKLYRDTF